MEETARFESVKIELQEPLGGVDSLSAVIGFPEWWPTGARIAVVIAHGDTDLNDPLVETFHRNLATKRFLTLRFNFPFAEAGGRLEDNSPVVLEKAYRAALALLGQDRTSAPTQLFLGGQGPGARVAAGLAATRVQADGLFFLGFPLHAEASPEQPEADSLYRIASPMLFVQGGKDPRCQLDVLRRTLSRVGAPTVLRIIEKTDGSLLPREASEREIRATSDTVSRVVGDWIEGILGNEPA
jgi:predicted alpha/beta-hydrolase family hydrolase